MSDRTKTAIYLEARRQIASLTATLNDPVAAMASVAAVLFELLPEVSWVGFYLVVAPRLLRVGPYQGPVGCLEIPFEKGVCGAAAREQQPQIVPDVHAFPGHIACDSRTRSEIVVPIKGSDGDLVAVLDLDSHQRATFDQDDLHHLEEIVKLLQPCFPIAESI